MWSISQVWATMSLCGALTCLTALFPVLQPLPKLSTSVESPLNTTTSRSYSLRRLKCPQKTSLSPLWPASSPLLVGPWASGSGWGSCRHSTLLPFYLGHVCRFSGNIDVFCVFLHLTFIILCVSLIQWITLPLNDILVQRGQNIVLVF